MENTIENKAKFFAQYWGQNIVCSDNKFFSQMNTVCGSEDNINWYYLLLKPLSMISDEDAIEVAKIVFQNNKDFKVVRRDEERTGSIHLEYKTDIDSILHCGISYRGEIFANHHFLQTERHPDKSSHIVNIGKVYQDAKQGIPYIKIIDLLRSKGFAVPFHDVSIEQQISSGWVQLSN